MGEEGAVQEVAGKGRGRGVGEGNKWYSITSFKFHHISREVGVSAVKLFFLSSVFPYVIFFDVLPSAPGGSLGPGRRPQPRILQVVGVVRIGVRRRNERDKAIFLVLIRRPGHAAQGKQKKEVEGKSDPRHTEDKVASFFPSFLLVLPRMFSLTRTKKKCLL